MSAVATKDMTRAAVLRLARAKWGPNAQAKYWPNAPTKQERLTALREMGVCRKRLRDMPLPQGNVEIARARNAILRQIKELESRAYWWPFNLSEPHGGPLPFMRGYVGYTWREVAQDAGLLPVEAAS